VIRAVADLVYRDMLRYKTRVIGNLDTHAEGASFALSPAAITGHRVGAPPAGRE
jgi:hypothetical protein